MDIHLFKCLDSTQRYAADALKSEQLHAPFAILANEQDAGFGSRNSKWESQAGNLYLSVAINFDSLADDIPNISFAIYFAMLMKMCLKRYGANVWVKWPNDLYVGDKKVGGIVTHVVKDVVVCGIGVNTQICDENYACLSLKITNEELAKSYISMIKKKATWKEIFSRYEIEFELSKVYAIHYGDERILLKNAYLQHDGSLEIDGKVIVNSR